MINKLKRTVKNVPIVGDLATLAYRKTAKGIDFTTSGEYWEQRYRAGADSGAGSYNALAKHKAEIINTFVKDNDVSTVIEFGSGDGNQLRYFDFDSYLGFDVSQTVVDNCRALYQEDPAKRFANVAAYDEETADLVLSLDVIYHLVEDEVFHDYMTNLATATERYLIVYSSNSDEHEDNGKHEHVRHRNFTNWLDEHAPDIKLIEHIPNKYQYNGNNDVSSYADFYLFARQAS